MAVDLRTERFAVDAFIQVFAWLDFGESPIPRPKDYGNLNETDFTTEISHLVLSRYLLYRGTLIDDLTDDYQLFSRNGVEFYYYLRNHETRCFPYPDMNIFDKLLMSIAFAAHMGALCYFRNNNIYKYVLPLSWAMYFENVAKEEFYAAGSWEELKSYAAMCDARIIYPDDVLVTALQQKKDIEIAKMLFKNSEQYFCLDTVVDTFKRRLDGRGGKSTCSKCQPLFDVLFSLSYASDVVIEDFKLAEGFFQIFLRMLTQRKFEEHYLRFVLCNLGDANIPPDPDVEELELLALANRPNLFEEVKAVYTERLLDRIFVTKNQDSSETENSDDKSKRCLFCGEDLNNIKSLNRGDDFERVESLKSVIRETVSSVQSSATTDSSQIETTSHVQTSDSAIDRKRLLLFLALGLEPTFRLIMASIEKEQEHQHRVQNVDDSMGNLKLGEKKNKKSKSQKKK